MERFRTCDECSRHVRAAEASCPFCGHVLEAAALMPVPRAPAQLSRAQRIALVAAVAGGGLLAACGDDAPGTPGPRAGAGVAGATAGTSAAGSSGAAAGSGTAGKGAAGSSVPVPFYGAAFPAPAGAGGAGESGSGGAAGSAGGAGAAGAGAGGAGGTAGKPPAAGSGGHMIQPLYGASPAYGVPPTPPKK